MGLFSFIGGWLGGNSSKKASRKAQAAGVAAETQAMNEIARQFDLTRSDYAPALSLLAPSVSALGDFAGLNGDEALQSRLGQVQQSPLLEALIRNGEEAVLQNASATGGIRGGNTQRGLADFRADAFNTALQQQLAQLGQTAGIGLGSTDSVSAFGANAAANKAQRYSNIGQINSGGILTRGGINSQMWNNAGSFLDNIVSSFAMPGSGGAGSILGNLF